MGKRKARDDAAAEKSVVTKRKTRRRARGASTWSTPGICDDVLRNIFARVPARTAVASMALSTHHRRLIRCPDFRALQRRLGPPLPHPHIAYVATAKVRRSGGARARPVSGYLGFHIAGGGSGNAPMRSLAGPLYLEKKYVNTCNGVVLLAGMPRPCTCVLWNPAVADEEKEVTVPASALDDCAILGLGYGPRTKTYKLLLTRRQKLLQVPTIRDRERATWSRKELLVYDALGGVSREQPRLRTLLSDLDGEISRESLYIDGTVYLLHLCKSAILAVDVDGETVTAIDLPGECGPWRLRAMSTPLVVSGRPCVDLEDDDGHGSIALWLLTTDHRWEMRCVIDGHRLDRYSIAGAWDCGGGVLFTYLHGDGEDDDKLFMYCCETKRKLAKGNLPTSKTPDRSDYAMCWGYKPTLISPGSIVGELNQDGDGDGERRRDKRIGQKATLGIVFFMEFLLRIMHALPDNMQDVIGMPLLKPEDSDYSSFRYSDSDSGSSDYYSD